jgi:hypothetical protein
MDIIKTMGKINQSLYGINPFEKKFDCDTCEDKGYVEKTEWSGTDDSYDITVKCACQED